MTTAISNVHYRLAQHYVGKLQQANGAFRRGNANRTYWYSEIERDWEQIRRWQAWSVSQIAPDDSTTSIERANLCVGFSIAGMDVLRVRQSPTERLTWLKQALEAAELVNNQEARRTLIFALAQSYFFMAKSEETQQLAQQLLKLSLEAGDTLHVGCAYRSMGTVAEQRGRFDEADTYYQKSFALLEKCQATAEIGRLYQGMGRIAAFRGDYVLAHDYFMRYLAIVEGTGREGELSVVLLTLSTSFTRFEEFDKAESHAQRAVQICRNIGFVRMLPAALLCLAMAENRQDKIADAITHYQEGIQVATSINMPNLVVSGIIDLGNIYRWQGDYATAWVQYQEGLELAQSKQAAYYVCDIWCDMTHLHLIQHQPAEALIILQQAIEKALQLGTEPYLAKTLLAVVNYLHYTGEAEQAATWFGVVQHYVTHVDIRLFNTTKANLAHENMPPDTALPLVEIIQNAQAMLG